LKTVVKDIKERIGSNDIAFFMIASHGERYMLFGKDANGGNINRLYDSQFEEFANLLQEENITFNENAQLFFSGCSAGNQSLSDDGEVENDDNVAQAAADAFDRNVIAVRNSRASGHLGNACYTVSDICPSEYTKEDKPQKKFLYKLQKSSWFSFRKNQDAESLNISTISALHVYEQSMANWKNPFKKDLVDLGISPFLLPTENSTINQTTIK
jgi:hypothetical protein